MHGLLSAAPAGASNATKRPGTVPSTSRSDFAADDVLMAAFPFPHELELEATLSGPTLTPGDDGPRGGHGAILIRSGFHPYLRLPEVAGEPRSVETPSRERVRPRPRDAADRRARASTDRPRAPGARRSTMPTPRHPPAPRSCSRAAAGGSSPAFEAGLSVRAGVRAARMMPRTAFEPMTAPANALVNGGPELTLLAPGDSYRAAFSITVRERDGSPGSE